MVQNARSKLFAMYMSKSLAEAATSPAGRIRAVVTSACPGACKSDLAREFKAAGLGYAIGLRLLTFCSTSPPSEEREPTSLPLQWDKRDMVAGTRLLRWQGTCIPAHDHSFLDDVVVSRRSQKRVSSPGWYVTRSEGQSMQSEVWNKIVASLKAEGFALA